MGLCHPELSEFERQHESKLSKSAEIKFGAPNLCFKSKERTGKGAGKGDRSLSAHGDKGTGQPKAACYNWWLNGACSYGGRCRFDHGGNTGPSAASVVAPVCPKEATTEAANANAIAAKDTAKAATKAASSNVTAAVVDFPDEGCDTTSRVIPIGDTARVTRMAAPAIWHFDTGTDSAILAWYDDESINLLLYATTSADDSFLYHDNFSGVARDEEHIPPAFLLPWMVPCGSVVSAPAAFGPRSSRVWTSLRVFRMREATNMQM